MKRKIIGIFVCLLLITTAVPAVMSLQNSAITPMAPGSIIQPCVLEIWTLQQKLLASDGAANDSFGFSVSVDGDTALIGAWYNADNGVGSGSAYVFTRTGSIWKQQAKLLALDGATYDFFGYSVSLDGDSALIGAYYDNDNGEGSGSAYVFTRTGTTWTQQAKLLASDGAAGDAFGSSVSLSRDTALIGAYGDENATGSAYMFTRSGTTWTQETKLLALDGVAYAFFGYSVSLDGDSALIGDPNDDTGSAYVFTRSGCYTWTQQAKLLASDGATGDFFGLSVSLDGDSALIGATADENATGSAYVFTRTDTTWAQQAKLLTLDGTTYDFFGYSVSLDGDSAISGAYGDENATGSAYVFTRTGTTWAQQVKLLALDGAIEDQFGSSVSISGDTALIGAYTDDDNGDLSGSTYVFTKESEKPDLTFSITGGLGVKLKITNNGIVNFTDVPWWFHVEGGILGRINITMNGTVSIPAQVTISVAILPLFGLGRIIITAKVADKEQTTTGWQIFIFSMVKK